MADIGRQAHVDEVLAEVLPIRQGRSGQPPSERRKDRYDGGRRY